ncbi:hypothetical protein N867_00465 [Actinotalea fermentans ATCC 43279 = JCM 9966 = DSM 3133]|nr:hypothetical protein N867_00465 [Actinotalea fermentans ATCC 43279 = JCM 9966 = DSM 3133]
MATMPDDAPALPEEPARPVEIATRHGLARAYVRATDRPLGVLVLGHGAGGGVQAPDLLAVSAAARGDGWSVVLVEQPYRVAGKKVPPRPRVLDEAWCDVLAALRARDVGAVPDGVPLVTGGRSAGARVACRTAEATGAAGVLALAFPTAPPGRPDLPSRLPELDQVTVPVLVVQGATDPYGVPPEGPGRRVVVVPGDHGLKKDVPGVVSAVRAWLAERTA